MSFGDIVLVDAITNALFAQAKHENLLEIHHANRMQQCRRNRHSIQKALSSIVLYNTVYILDYFMPDQIDEWKMPSIPLLESEGILSRFYSLPEFARSIAGKGSNWYENRDPDVFRQALDNVIAFLPFVLNKLVKEDDSFVDKICSTGIISKRRMLSEIIRYARSFYANDEMGLKTNVLHYLGDKFVSNLHKDLRSQKPRDGLNAIDVVLFGAMFHYEQFNTYRLLSENAKAPVYGANLSPSLARRLSIKQSIEEAEKSADSFAILRMALDQEGFFFPYVESITDALKLRRNPNIKSFREKVHELDKAIRSKDINAIEFACGEAKKANIHLEKSETWGQRLRWVTYFSLPASLIESAVWGIPFVGGSLSLISVIGTRMTNMWSKKSRWALVGR